MIRGLIIFTLISASLAFGANSILFVADFKDGVSYPQDFTTYYRNACENAENSFIYSYWDHDSYGSPTLEDMEPYQMVVWYLGASGEYPASNPYFGEITITIQEQERLIKFLDSSPGDRSLLIIGLYSVWNTIADVDNQTTYPSKLFDQFMGVDYPADNFGNWIEVEDSWRTIGVAGDPIMGDKNYILNWRFTKNYPDQLELLSGASGVAKWVDTTQNRHHHSIIRNNGPKNGGYEFKTAIMSLPLECLEETDDRIELWGNIINWLGYVPPSGIESSSVGKIKASFK